MDWAVHMGQAACQLESADAFNGCEFMVGLTATQDRGMHKTSMLGDVSAYEQAMLMNKRFASMSRYSDRHGAVCLHLLIVGFDFAKSQLCMPSKPRRCN